MSDLLYMIEDSTGYVFFKISSTILCLLLILYSINGIYVATFERLVPHKAVMLQEKGGIYSYCEMPDQWLTDMALFDITGTITSQEKSEIILKYTGKEKFKDRDLVPVVNDLICHIVTNRKPEISNPTVEYEIRFLFVGELEDRTVHSEYKLDYTSISGYNEASSKNLNFIPLIKVVR